MLLPPAPLRYLTLIFFWQIYQDLRVIMTLVTSFFRDTFYFINESFSGAKRIAFTQFLF